LEINTNPCLSPEAGYVAALEEVGIGYDEAVRRLVERAVATPCRDTVAQA
jgi:D-alanine-D-alanine ligase